MHPVKAQLRVLAHLGAPGDPAQARVVLEDGPDVEQPRGDGESASGGDARGRLLPQQHGGEHADVHALLGVMEQGTLVREDTLGVEVHHVLQVVAVARRVHHGRNVRAELVEFQCRARDHPVDRKLARHGVLVLLRVPRREVRVPVRHDWHPLRVQESHGVLELRELVDLDRTNVREGLAEPQRGLAHVLELDLQDGEGEAVDLVLRELVRSDVAPRLRGVAIGDVLIQQRHLCVQRDTDLVARGQLERAAVVRRADDRLELLRLDHLVHLHGDALHGLAGLVGVDALGRQLRVVLIDVEVALHKLEDHVLRDDAPLLGGLRAAEALVVDLALHEDLLVVLQVVLAVPSEAHQAGALLAVDALLVAHAVGAVEVDGAKQLRLLHGAGVGRRRGLHVHALVLQVQESEGLQELLLLRLRSAEDQVGQMLDDARLEQHDLIGPDPVLRGVADEGLGRTPGSVRALLRALRSAPEGPGEAQQHEDVVEAYAAEGLGVQPRDEERAAANAGYHVEELRDLLEAHVIQAHVHVKVLDLRSQGLDAFGHGLELLANPVSLAACSPDLLAQALAVVARAAEAQEERLVLHAGELVDLVQLRLQQLLKRADRCLREVHEISGVQALPPEELPILRQVLDHSLELPVLDVVLAVLLRRLLLDGLREAHGATL
mmetsp:Transcript_44798/g.115939  ORF Transcript_44798/g.115939 Transcript_44798/m.115939 type:complete len:663 (-) Transcript_44798:59-2047(-)